MSAFGNPNPIEIRLAQKFAVEIVFNTLKHEVTSDKQQTCSLLVLSSNIMIQDSTCLRLATSPRLEHRRDNFKDYFKDKGHIPEFRFFPYPPFESDFISLFFARILPSVPILSLNRLFLYAYKFESKTTYLVWRLMANSRMVISQMQAYSESVASLLSLSSRYLNTYKKESM